MPLLRIALLPFAWLYGVVLMARHGLYDAGVLKSTRPTLPTIAVGNLALGGTGKTPMLELILRELADTGRLATLSRGYGRSGSDIHEVGLTDTAERSGDEPIQIKRNFPEVSVFVGADRAGAIEQIQRDSQVPNVVVLDDALQHRRLDAGLKILLTTWHRPWCDDELIPAGRLRDLPSRSKAADIVVVTKCPVLPEAKEQEQWRSRLGLAPAQELFFSAIDHADPIAITPGPVLPTSSAPKKTIACLLFTGIADPGPLVGHVRSEFGYVEHLSFGDHHAFTLKDLDRLAKRFDIFAPGSKMLVTTEKDAARLRSVIAGSPIEGLPIATIGIRVKILNEPQRFAALIRNHVATHPAHR
ncbi:MAG: tetraacyldisaccharide 4'-kinase [Flavobacteriales bacterium]|nr:tetraacyldisaccharide 4'-kinase [Flavobacteriales bacterium]